MARAAALTVAAVALVARTAAAVDTFDVGWSKATASSRVTIQRYSGKKDPSKAKDATYWTSFMEQFEAARGLPIATITKVDKMSTLTHDDAAVCGRGTVTIGKYVTLPPLSSFTHGKYVTFLEQEAVEQVQLCGGRYAIHTKWSADAIKTMGTSDDELTPATMDKLVGPKALDLAAPAVVYKLTAAKFRSLVKPLVEAVDSSATLPPLYVSAESLGVDWSKKVVSSSSGSSSGASGVSDGAKGPTGTLSSSSSHIKIKGGRFTAPAPADLLDHSVNIATAAEAAIEHMHARHRLRAAKAGSGGGGVALLDADADADAAALEARATLLEVAAAAGTTVINRPWGHFSGLDPYYDWSVLGLFCFSLVTRANCLAYATYSYSGVLRPNIRYCHPGQASNGVGAGLPGGWGAGWALPPVQRAAVGGMRTDYDISGYLPVAQGGVLAGGVMGGGGAAGECATMLTYLQAGGGVGLAAYVGDALLGPVAAAAAVPDYHDVYVTFHKFAIVESYNPGNILHQAAIQDGNPVNVWDTTTNLLRIRANFAAVVGTDIPVAVGFDNDNAVDASDYHFHRRNSNAWFGGAVQWSDKNGGQPTRCCWPNPAVKDAADAGAGGFPASKLAELQAAGATGVLLGYRDCGTIYSRPTQLMTVANGGHSPHNCA